MSLKLKNLLINTEGSWISQRTIYYLKSKKLKNFNIKHYFSTQNSTGKISKQNLFNKDVYMLEWCNINTPKQNLYLFEKNIKKIYQNIIKEYSCTQYKNNYLEIKYRKKNIECLEYFYQISQTFRISIGLIKKEDKYVAISFTSEIQIIQN